MTTSMKYRPDIDGLRAVAVLSVILAHCGFPLFYGGYIGVDVFFVISGFLITSIICKEILDKKFSFVNFYERRARRILPALYLVVFVCFVPAWFLLTSADFIDFSETVIGSVLFSSNIVLYTQTGYFDQAAELKPLLHTWSLAIEEQYYLFFPVFMLLLYRFKRLNVLYIILIPILLSLALSQWWALTKPTINYYLLPTRAWELLIGSATALLVKQADANKAVSIAVSSFLSSMGLLMVIIPIFIFDEVTLFPSLWALFPTLGTALIIYYCRPNTVVYSILSNKIFIGIGLISYSAYLWNQPIFAFMRHQNILAINTITMTASIAATLLLAFLSWKYIEQPFRDKIKWTSKSVWLFSLCSSIFLIAIAIVIIINDGFKGRFKLSGPLTIENFDLPKRSNGWCFYSVDSNELLELGSKGFECKLGDATKPPRVLLFGDSYAGMYEPLWDRIGKEYSFSLNAITTNWCHPTLSANFWWKSPTRALQQCIANREHLKITLDNYDVVIISGVWSIIERNGLTKDIEDFIDVAINQYKVKVVIMPQPQMFTNNSVTNAVYKNLSLHIDTETDRLAQTQNTRFLTLSQAHDRVYFIERDSLFYSSDTKDSSITNDALPYSLDGGHISIYGSNKAAENILTHTKGSELKAFLFGTEEN